MKQYFVNLSITFCISILLLLTFSCKRTDYWPPECCVPRAACNVQTHYVTNIPPNVAPPYVIPYQFTRTTGANGRVNYIDADINFFDHAGGTDGGHFKGEVKQNGPHLFVIDSARDTLVVVDLDKCGRAVKSLIHYRANLQYDAISEYYYDNKGRLSKVHNVGRQVTETYQYDQYDNITRITHSNAPGTAYMEFTYDYNRPLKGSFYDLGRFAGPMNEVVMIEILGLLNTQPHHMMTKTFSGSTFYPNGTSTYYDQQVNANGYLVSYKARLFDRDNISIKGDIVWDCDKGGGNKY
ncbi:hypothetical protein [Chitinophaga sp. 212800010-3]|uniref:hypothetical protein n=1 Tax=unclassified Chitinophaga TaxID=2619133 RepID=UPI002DF2221D|nr:hypothetical protein [Chitinophaga sp. 212800010-3]